MVGRGGVGALLLYNRVGVPVNDIPADTHLA